MLAFLLTYVKFCDLTLQSLPYVPLNPILLSLFCTHLVHSPLHFLHPFTPAAEVAWEEQATLLTSLASISWWHTLRGLTGLPRYSAAFPGHLFQRFPGHRLGNNVTSLYLSELLPILHLENFKHPSHHQLMTSILIKETGNQKRMSTSSQLQINHPTCTCCQSSVL